MYLAHVQETAGSGPSEGNINHASGVPIGKNSVPRCNFCENVTSRNKSRKPCINIVILMGSHVVWSHAKFGKGLGRVGTGGRGGG